MQSCINYREINEGKELLKLKESSKQQHGFMLRKSTTDPTFALRMLMENCREGSEGAVCLCGSRESI